MNVHWRVTIPGFFLALCSAPSHADAAAGPEGFSIADAQGDYAVRIGGMIQVDGRYFADGGADADDGFLVRRARITLDGRFGPRVSFRIRPESSAGDFRMIDVYVETALSEAVTLRAGKFKPPLGLERLQTAGDLRLIERSFVTELVPSRDVGVQLAGRAGFVSWALGVFNGVVDGRTGDAADDGSAEGALRLFAEPLDRSETGGPLLGVGVAASLGDREGSPGATLLGAVRSAGQVPVFEYRTGGNAAFADGRRLRLSPQFYWYRGPFGVTGEWVRVSQDVAEAAAGRSATLDHEAWQVTGEWFLTGESAGYRDPVTAGGVQLVARVSAADFDDASFDGGSGSFADPAVSVSRARAAALGVNWFPVRGIKASLVYSQTAFDGGAGAGDRPDEKLVLMRLQHAF